MRPLLSTLSIPGKTAVGVAACRRLTVKVTRSRGSSCFSTTSRNLQAKNQIFSPVRNLDQFHTYQLLASSARVPLLTLWTASWCPTCKTVCPLLRDLVASGTGELEGGVAYCEVEVDAPDVVAAGLGLTHMITCVPTLLSFDAQEARAQTKVVDGRRLADRGFLQEWIREEARRCGGGGGMGGGGEGGSSVFGGLFGSK